MNTRGHKPVSLWLLVLSIVVAATTSAQDKITYNDHAGPLFRQRCAKCHNGDKRSGDLDVTNFSSIMQGGASGEVIEPGDPDNSYLYMLVDHQDEPNMPPESDKLPDAEIALLKQWIKQGALESKGSKAAPPKKKITVAVTGDVMARPEKPPWPARLSRQPPITTRRSNASSAIAVSPWASVAAVAGQKQILLYNTKDGMLLGILPFPEGVPNILRFSRNGSLLLAGGGTDGLQGKAIVWDIMTGRRIIEVGDELDTVLAADISSDQLLIALGGPQRVVRVYSTATGEVEYEIRKHTDWITALEFSPDGVLLTTGDRNGGLFVWEAFTGREYLTLKGHKKSITDVTWRADSNAMASSSEDSSIRLWEMFDGRQIKSWNGHGGGTTSVEFSRDGRLATCGRDKTAKLWDQNGKQLKVIGGFQDILLDVAFCNETNKILAGDWYGNYRLFTSADAKPAEKLTANAPTIEQRLSTLEADQAKAILSADTRTHQETQAAASADKLAAHLTTLTDQRQQARATMERLKPATAATQRTVDTLNEKRQTATTEHSKLAAALPKLRDALEQLTSATDLSHDAEIAASRDKTKSILAVKEKQATQLRTQLNQLAERIAAAKSQLTQQQDELRENQSLIGTTAESFRQLTDESKQAALRATSAARAADQARSWRDELSQQVAFWKAELKFDGQLKSIHQQRAAAQESLAAAYENRARLDEATTAAKQTLDAALTEVAAAEKQLAENTARRADVEGQIQALTTERDGLPKQIEQLVADRETLDLLIADVQPTIDVLNKSLQVRPNDQALKTLIEQSMNVIESWNAEIVSSEQQQTTLKQRITKIAEILTTEKGELTRLNQRYAAIRQMITDHQAKIPPAQAAHDIAIAALAKSQTTVEEKQAKFDAVDGQLLSLQTAQ